MTSFRIESFAFRSSNLALWSRLDPRHQNWPVVYALDGSSDIYVGETLNAAGRLRQHLENDGKRTLVNARIVIDETFNKSACLDLESHLIRLFAGEGRYRVLNRNDGIRDADYFNRAEYRKTFDAVFDQLRRDGVFSRTVREIENSDLFKLSPFKALTPDQAIAVEDILSGLFQDLEAQRASRIVIQGDPGTGKTVVAIFLMKLLADIQHFNPTDPIESDSILSEFFTPGHPELLDGFRVGLVVPQQSLRASVQKVFRSTPGLRADAVMTPFQVGESPEHFDLLIVDETHRLNQRANQSSGVRNQQFRSINEALFGEDDPAITQLDWIAAKSTHQIYLLDAAQSVRPADIPTATLEDLQHAASQERRTYPLSTQMRVQAGADYIGYVRAMLTANPPQPTSFAHYDFKLFDDLGDMLTVLRAREQEGGLSRLVAGYAWPWLSRTDPNAYDIEIDRHRLRWNSSAVDWINSRKSIDEVGSIHTTQGYDLNFAGVIIGRDLRWDDVAGRPYFDRANYYDAKGKENNKLLGVTYTDDDLLRYVTNIYAVLLTRGIRGTYVYICDRRLREALRPLINVAGDDALSLPRQ